MQAVLLYLGGRGEEYFIFGISHAPRGRAGLPDYYSR